MRPRAHAPSCSCARAAVHHCTCALIDLQVQEVVTGLLGPLSQSSEGAGGALHNCVGVVGELSKEVDAFKKDAFAAWEVSNCYVRKDIWAAREAAGLPPLPLPRTWPLPSATDLF